MATIIAFEVPDAATGGEALARLTGLVDDTALAYRDAHGVVRVHQAGDLRDRGEVVAHGLLGVLVALATTQFLQMPTGGERLAAARRELRGVGVDLDALGIGGERINDGGAAAFMVADDDTVQAIESALRSAGYRDVRCLPVPDAAVEVLRGTQRLR
jgi:uncharacterized membrane protein